MLTYENITTFRNTVYSYYHANKRIFPWRLTKDPYLILISEVMLQQTQVDRVIEKYREFTGLFPDTKALAAADLYDVMAVWKGLGYNRRAVMLRNMAIKVCEEYAGRIPETSRELLSLPGIGKYTASAVMAFAYNQPVMVIETNIRSVFIHHFFKNFDEVADNDIIPFIEATLDHENPRDWYNALMDYGTYIKKMHKNPSRKSRHYTKQSKFKGSDREIRGKIIGLLIEHKTISFELVVKAIAEPAERLLRIIDKMLEERVISCVDDKYML